MGWVLLLGICVAIFSSFISATPAETRSSHTALVGDKECLDGPSYWCQNLMTASKCQALHHCVHTVWRHQQQVPNLDVCESCKSTVTYAKNVLCSDKTKENIMVLFEVSCKAIPLQVWVNECVTLVESNFPQIFEGLCSSFDPQEICSTLHLCDSPQPKQLIKTYKPFQSRQMSSGRPRVPFFTSGANGELPVDSEMMLPEDKEMCQFCEFFMSTTAKDISTNKLDIIKQAEEMCTAVPKKFRTICPKFVKTYAGAVIDLLAQDINQVCPKIGVCPGFSNSDVRCEPCKLTALHLTNRIGSNTSKTNIEKELMTLCLTLDYEESRHCSQMLASHRKDIVDMVSAGFTSNEMCTYMNYCTAKSSLAASGGDTETNEISKTLPDEQEENGLCELCHFVVQLISSSLQSGLPKILIRQFVTLGCYLLPDPVRDECVEFVGDFADRVIEFVAKSLDPTLVCQMILLCPFSGSLQYVPRNVHYNNNFTSGILADFQNKFDSVNKCLACELLFGAVQGPLQDYELRREINSQLAQVCLSLPESMTKQCQDLMSEAIPQVEVLLTDIPLAPIVCQTLNLCEEVGETATDRCSKGQSYWCLSTTHAAACQKIEYCQKNVWFAEKPTRKDHR